MTAQFASIWALYVLLSWLPSYFREAHGVSIANAGLYSSAPWLAMFAGTTVAAPLSDALIRRGVDVTRGPQAHAVRGPRGLRHPAARGARRALLVGGAVGAVPAPRAHSASRGSATRPASSTSRRASSALLYGFGNTIATVPGIVGVSVTGWLVDVTGTYAAAFALTAAISAIGAVVFGTLFSSRPLVD